MPDYAPMEWVKLEVNTLKNRETAMSMTGIREALDWAAEKECEVKIALTETARLRSVQRQLEEEAKNMNERLTKLAEDNMQLVDGTNRMLDDHKKVVANLLIEVETVKSNAAAQAEALTAEVEHLKRQVAAVGYKPTRKR